MAYIPLMNCLAAFVEVRISRFYPKKIVMVYMCR
jgi:hypothetical protein